MHRPSGAGLPAVACAVINDGAGGGTSVPEPSGIISGLIGAVLFAINAAQSARRRG
jgi:hypothetical protein